jgi:hypothetical protein
VNEEDGADAPRDEGLEAFVQAIEAALRTRRGVERVLSPRDFALARSWYEAGVPLAAVLVGLDLAFDANPDASSLAACRRRIEDLAGEDRRPASAARVVERLTLPELGERLTALRERLQELPGRVAALPLQDVLEVGDLVAVASRPNWDYLRTRLRRIDDLVAAAAVESLTPAEAEALRAEATRAAERHRDRVDPGALEQALDRYLRQRARERLRLPRVAVD